MHLDHGLGGRVAVIGDVMLDVYISGDAWRISPEAPVPIVAVRSRTSTLGGAGNVALNLAGLGCQSWLFGVISDDVAGVEVARILDKNGITNVLEIDNTLPTTTKTRVMANSQQLLRFDEEGRFNGDNGRYGWLVDKVIGALSMNDVGAVVLSDYNKGVLSGNLVSRVVDYCRKSGIKVLVDPKRGDWGSYAGVDLIKPNLHEFREVTGSKEGLGHDEILSLARRMMAEYSIGSILVTMGSRGMLLVERGRNEYIPAQAKEVFDVSGAGDTVIATIAACLCSGMTLAKSARIANRAAGIVVGKVGTCPISLRELRKQ